MEGPTVHSQCTVEAAATPTSFPNSYASDAYPQESCLNDVWGGVGGNGHRWMAGQLRGDWRAGVAVCSERMTASWMKDRDVRHVRISLSDRVSTHDQDMVQNPSLDYSPGDVANVLPRNRPAAVEEFIYIMGLDGSARIRSIEPTDSSCGYAMSRLNVVPPCSVTDLISAHFDIEGVPRCRLIKRLALSARDAMQREKLLELASPEGADELQEYLRGGRRTVTTLLQDFPSVR